MKPSEKFSLITRNTAEIITEDKLKDLIREKKQPVVYCGYEPSGQIHLGHFVTFTKLIEFQKAGFKVIILLADIHSQLNRKKPEVKLWEDTVKAMGIKAEIVLGSSFQFKKEYQMDIMKLAQSTTINRGLRSMQEIARDLKNATISQLWYPLMQAADIKYLKVDVALGGMEQRKVHMIGKDMAKTLEYDFIPIHTPLITSLKGPGEKMSSSSPGSLVSISESKDQIQKIINKSYCPSKIVEDNPILQIAQLIIFPQKGKLHITRPRKFGGDLLYIRFEDLEKDYASGKLHPSDLKNGVAENIDAIIEPIRKNLK
jgi:tyrosyl-tRNA synthetase